MNPSKAELLQFCGPCDKLLNDGTCTLDAHKRERTPLEALEETVEQIKLRSVFLSELKKDGINISPQMQLDQDARVAGCSDQVRYVLRNCCGRATLNGQRGVMTKAGFTPDKDSEASTSH